MPGIFAVFTRKEPIMRADDISPGALDVLLRDVPGDINSALGVEYTCRPKTGLVVSNILGPLHAPFGSSAASGKSVDGE